MKETESQFTSEAAAVKARQLAQKSAMSAESMATGPLNVPKEMAIVSIVEDALNVARKAILPSIAMKKEEEEATAQAAQEAQADAKPSKS